MYVFTFPVTFSSKFHLVEAACNRGPSICWVTAFHLGLQLAHFDHRFSRNCYEAACFHVVGAACLAGPWYAGSFFHLGLQLGISIFIVVSYIVIRSSCFVWSSLPSRFWVCFATALIWTCSLTSRPSMSFPRLPSGSSLPPMSLMCWVTVLIWACSLPS